MRPSFLAAALAAIPAACCGPAAAQAPTGGAKVYKQVIPSVVWVISAREKGSSTATGVLVDRDRRLVLTNHHVVSDNPVAVVFFPVLRDGQPVSERQYYKDRVKQLGYRGRVIAKNEKTDLAVIQLADVPEGVPAIPLARAGPGPGETIHFIGNAGKSGALWGYVKGTVRHVYHKKWQSSTRPGQPPHSHDATVIESDAPTNHGDSGSPVLNDAGELVGVNQGAETTDARLITFSIDLSEVKRLLADPAVAKADPTATDPAAAASRPPRAAPLTVDDRAKLFSADAVAVANAAIAELDKKHLDVKIETYPTPPAEWAEKARAATAADQSKLFNEWAAERVKDGKVAGVMVLICKSPGHTTVTIRGVPKGSFPPKYAQKINDALFQRLRDKKADEGLAAALKLIRDGYTEDAK